MLPMAKPSPTHNGAKELVALGVVIKNIRLDMGLSQEALANEVGIDRSYMGGIERGEHNLAMINLIKIAKTLKYPAAEILKKAGL